MNAVFNIIAIFAALAAILFLGPLGFILIFAVLAVWFVANVIEAVGKAATKPRRKGPPPLPRQ
jgi:hypothetical protein